MHAPKLPRRPTQAEWHGRTYTDPFGAYKPDNYRDVLDDPSQLPSEIHAWLSAEASYAQHHIDETTTATWVKDLKSRMAPALEGAPLPDGDWRYNWAFGFEADYPVYTRAQGDGEFQVYFDAQALAGAHAFFDLGTVTVSPDHQRLAYTRDLQGNERYELLVREIGQADRLLDLGWPVQAGVVWQDSDQLLYVRLDAQDRGCEVRRFTLSTGQDTPVYAETAEDWFIDIAESQCGRFIWLEAHQHQVSEIRALNRGTGVLSEPIAPRSWEVEYEVEADEQGYVIRANKDHPDFALFEATFVDPQTWHLRWAPEAGTLVDFSVLKDWWMTLTEVEQKPELRWFDRAGKSRRLTLPEPISSLSLEGALTHTQDWQRLAWSSPRHPGELWELDLPSGEIRVLKRQTLPRGHNPDDYRVERLWASSRDGTRVPMTLIARADAPPSPTFLTGYGAYGVNQEPAFSSARLALVDQGIDYLVAHVRGGMELGDAWYKQATGLGKALSFDDFEACLDKALARHDKVVVSGGSAGGLLVGNLLNRRASDLAGVLADVPFVDALNTLLDPDLPLTPVEWPEWGNPIESAEAFEAIRGWTPYENVTGRVYPPVWINAGLTDPRVTFWEPLKWLAKLRENQQGAAPLVLHMDSVGHGGPPGRYGHLNEVALSYAFAYRCLKNDSNTPA